MSIGRVALWLVRRVIAPVLFSTLALTGILFLLGSTGSSGSAPPAPVSHIFAELTDIFLVFTAPAILLVGLPSGYLVGRLRAGLAASLLILLAFGAAAGMLIVELAFNAVFAQYLLSFGAIAGATTALTWAVFNADLFRRAATRQP